MTWQIIGHEWAIEFLQHSLATGRVAHAYLFTGPPQVGKVKLARALAQALNCTGPEPPCGHCRSCEKVDKDSHPDIRVIEGEGAGGSLKIDQIRALQREAMLAPYESRYRVYILRRADLASLEAANSLLKILEEPPQHVVLILTAVQPESLPATIASRCQRRDLRPVARRLLESVLHERGIEEQRARLLVRLSGGRAGWALDASQEKNVLERRQQDLDQMIELLAATRVERLGFAWKISRNSDASRALLELWTGWWRDLLLVHSQGQDHVINVDRRDELDWMASQSSMPQARRALDTLLAATAQLEANVNARLAWEGLLLNLPRFRIPPQHHEEKAGAGDVATG
jgi:DNA polymerase-3 subunit delta'